MIIYKNEKKVQFFLTYRLSLIKDANLIVVFHEGRY